MEETTVKQLIGKLSKMNPEAIVCKVEVDSNNQTYFTSIEFVYDESDALFINDAGDEIKGNIVAIY